MPPHIDWGQYDPVIIRSIWDYTWKIEIFQDWIEKVEQKSRFVNPVSLVRWNYDKRYLIGLADAGIPVVETHFIPDWSIKRVMRCLEQNRLDDVVLKPSVSAGGRNTVRLQSPTLEAVEKFVSACPQRGALMVQKFAGSIVTGGEISALYIDGKITHCVRKTAKDGEFRVRFTYGGKESTISVDKRYRKFANNVIAALEAEPFYARIDFIEDEAGKIRLMELELIEPKMFFAHSKEAAERFAHGLRDKINE